tara:strand:- start:1368 stop:1727 length:360 start_codon:yes stop_codon:yes gene_type:complete
MLRKNVLGTELTSCSCKPITGWYRDGSCRTDISDKGMHTVCAVMTKQFLSYSKAQGNDLSSAKVGFPGLKEGDHWCICAPRWKEAYQDGMAPLIKLEATEESTLNIIEIEILRKFSHDH